MPNTACASRASRVLLLVALVLAATSWTPGARADDWAAPEPVSFHGRGMEYVAEIFPPKSRQNATERPLAVLYQMAYPTERWGVSGRVVWKGALVNREMPYEAILSMSGRLVTLDDYGNLGEKNAVVVYRADGTVARSLALSEIVPETDLGNAERSESSIYWRRKARYFFVDKPARLYIALAWGAAAEIGLDDGQVRYQKASAFPSLVPLLAQGGNAEVEIWRTSLRFSSITDLQALGGAGAAPSARSGPSAHAPAPPPPAASEPPRSGSCAGCALTSARAPRVPFSIVGLALALALSRRIRVRRQPPLSAPSPSVSGGRSRG